MIYARLSIGVGLVGVMLTGCAEVPEPRDPANAPQATYIRLDSSGSATENLLQDPQFETTVSEFHSMSAQGSTPLVSLTSSRPIEGRASLRIALNATNRNAVWERPLNNSNVQSAALFTVSFDAAKDADAENTVMLCGEADYDTGEVTGACVRLPTAEQRVEPVSLEVPLDRTRVLDRIRILTDHRAGAASAYVLDNGQVALSGVETRTVVTTPDPGSSQADSGSPADSGGASDSGSAPDSGGTPIVPQATPQAEPTPSDPAPVVQPEPEPVVIPTPTGPTLMHPNSFFYRDVSKVPKHPESDKVIAWMSQPGNSFDPNDELRMEFSLKLMEADDSAPMRTFTKTRDWYPVTCDYTPLPVPYGGALEKEANYTCTSDLDCHLLVFHRPSGLLYELWRANIPNGLADGPNFAAGCLVIWDSAIDYGMEGRGANCTGADAAGFPIGPMLFTPDEVAAGEINHAIRFVLPNRNIRRGKYIAPATNVTSAASGPDGAPPYGAHLRLKANFDMSRVRSDGGRVVARAMQKYGMYLADGGAYAITGSSDQFTSVKWCDHDKYRWCDEDPNRVLHEHDLIDIDISDFEMVDNGPILELTGSCEMRFPTPTP